MTITLSMIEDRLNTTIVGDTALEDHYTALIEDAEAIIEDYLGYALASGYYTEIIDGEGTNILRLSAQHINSISYVKQDGITIDSSNYFTPSCGCMVQHKTWNWVDGVGNYEIRYNAGWDSADIPQSIKAMICDLVIGLHNTLPTRGITNEQVDVASYAYGSTSNVVLSDIQRMILDKYRCSGNR